MSLSFSSRFSMIGKKYKIYEEAKDENIQLLQNDEQEQNVKESCRENMTENIIEYNENSYESWEKIQDDDGFEEEKKEIYSKKIMIYEIITFLYNLWLSIVKMVCDHKWCIKNKM